MIVDVDPEKLMRFAELCSFMVVRKDGRCRICEQPEGGCRATCLGNAARVAYERGGTFLQEHYRQLAIVLKVWKDGPPT